MSVRVLAFVSILMLGLIPTKARATCEENCFDITGTWQVHSPGSEAFFILELVQDGNNITGTRETSAAGCWTLLWPVSGTIEPGTGEFSFTDTNPDPPSSNPFNPCVDSDEFVGGFDSASEISADSTSWWEAVAPGVPLTGSVVGTLQSAAPVLTVDQASIIRGNNATFSLQNLGTGTASNWHFEAAAGTANRTTSTAASTWAGVVVSSGTARVTVTRNGVVYNPARTISVVPRNTTFTAVSPTQVTNGFNSTLTVPDPPQPDGSLGHYQLTVQYFFTAATVSGDGPNGLFKWVDTVVDRPNPGTPPTFRYVIAPALEDTGSNFYLAQSGTYNINADVTPACSSTDPETVALAGYISGAALSANAIRHEAGSAPSHYVNYVTTNSADNIGTVGEQMVAAGATNIATFTNTVDTALAAVRTTNISATAEEPCGTSDVRLNAQCVCNGYIRFP
jgi:hypothetical protein